jgi:outer membrane protein assembly factor BamA
MNNYAIGSVEYRFPVWTMPCFDIWLLSDYSDMLKQFFVRFDGALFVDAARIWHDLPHPLTQKQTGAGFGAGLRIMAPTLRRSVCVDVAWGGVPHSNPVHMDFFNVPAIYLYLDTYF